MAETEGTIPVVTGVAVATDTAPIGMNANVPVDTDAAPRGTNELNGMLQVIAPMDLPAGYLLEVDVNGQRQKVSVPAGGVKEGQSFQVQPMGSAGVGVAGSVADGIPVGKWRDGICDCCKFGPCHAMCCLGYWCTAVLAGQVMTRMSRNFCGMPGDRPKGSNTCLIVTGIWLFLLIAQGILRIIISTQQCAGAIQVYDVDSGVTVIQCPDGSYQNYSPVSQVSYFIHSALGFAFCVYFLIAACHTRAAIRKRYQIPEGSCGACEDCCCTFWCACCTVTQMARHTHDYAANDVNCCSSDCFNKRGQPEFIPEIDP